MLSLSDQPTAVQAPVIPCGLAQCSLSIAAVDAPVSLLWLGKRHIGRFRVAAVGHQPDQNISFQITDIAS